MNTYSIVQLQSPLHTTEYKSNIKLEIKPTAKHISEVNSFECR